MSYLEDSVYKPNSLQSLTLKGFLPEPVAPAPVGKTLNQRVDFLAAHMVGQWREHEAAIQNANRLFDDLLKEMEAISEAFRSAFAERDLPASGIFTEVDADRSVGILNILWHTISFTARGNTKPLAFFRQGQDPLFTGRIIALHGDFQDLAFQDQEYPDLLQYEIASLYVPADPDASAVMKIKHLGGEERYLHQSDAARLFLLKTTEMICGGGYFHEQEM